jgi:SAM-dependent methyltransferase
MTWHEYSIQELREVSDAVGERSGWDFSRMSTEREPVPWDFVDIVIRYLKPTDTVLDVGTGGGERLLSLAPHYRQAVGIDPDPEMIQVARANGLNFSQVEFLEMGAEDLSLDHAMFDVVLTRHAPTYVPELDRVTKPGGLFICQGVGAHNMANIRQAFKTGSPTLYEELVRAQLKDLVARGWHIMVHGDYDVRYWVKDLPSLLFWFKAIAGANEVPADFSVTRHQQTINFLVQQHSSDKGLVTNEHRTLLIARKPIQT